MKEREALAVLIHNSGTRSRSTDLVTLADAEDSLLKLYGISRAELANRLGLSVETLRVYSLAGRLPSDVKSLVRTRLIDGPETLEVITRLHDRNRQSELARTLIAYGLGTKDARAIERFARDNPKLSIEACVSRVLASKPTIERRYAIVTELRETTLKGLESRNSEVKSILTQQGLTEILSCTCLRNIMVLVVGEAGFSLLKKIAQDAGVSIDMAPDELVSRGLKRQRM